VPPITNVRSEPNGGESLDLADIRNSLQAVMWRQVGVERTASSLREALDAVEGWCRYVLPRQFSDPQGWQLQNMLQVARLMIHAALVRDETRGVHFRSDCPETSDAWLTHVAWHRGDAKPRLEPLARG
jgi:L-aspartate oxidase